MKIFRIIFLEKFHTLGAKNRILFFRLAMIWLFIFIGKNFNSM
jgi:hypothetical protein